MAGNILNDKWYLDRKGNLEVKGTRVIKQQQISSKMKFDALSMKLILIPLYMILKQEQVFYCLP